jgi:hypothetical protein
MTATPKFSERLRLALACCVSGLVAAACAASAPEPLQPTSEHAGGGHLLQVVGRAAGDVDVGIEEAHGRDVSLARV